MATVMLVFLNYQYAHCRGLTLAKNAEIMLVLFTLNFVETPHQLCNKQLNRVNTLPYLHPELKSA